MASSNIYITPSTSLILIKRFDRPTTIFLSTFNVPDFKVNVRDTTGSSSIQINLSTIGGAKFTNNTTLYQINQPYGFVNMSLRTSSFWQVLHTSGQTPASSAANIETTRISTLYFGLLSTAVKRVSTLVIENLDTPNSIQLTGPFVIGNLSTPGFVLLQSTLNVYGNVSLDKQLFVSGATSTLSSFFVGSLLPLSSPIVTFSSLGAGGMIQVGNSVTVFSTLHTLSSLTADTLFVQKSTNDITVRLFQNLSTTDSLVSSLQGLTVQDWLSVGRISVTESVSSLSGAFQTNALYVSDSLTVRAGISSQTAIVSTNLTLQSSLSLLTNLSTLSSVFIGNSISTSGLFTTLLSSSASFSTAGDFTVLSTLTSKGILSTASINVRGLLSIGTDLTSSYTISTGTAFLRAYTGETTILNSAQTSSFGAVHGNLLVQNQTFANSAFFAGDVTVEGDLRARNAGTFNSNLQVMSSVTVASNMTVLGVTNILTYDVGSYQVSSLTVLTSSPYYAVQASTFVGSQVYSDLAQFSYFPASGSITISTGTSSILTSLLYSKEFKSRYLSTQTLFTESMINPTTILPRESFPEFEVEQKSIFARGISTPFVNTCNMIADVINASFVGNGEFITNTSLTFSTVSATTVLVSSILTNVLSSGSMFVALRVNSTATVFKEYVFQTPFFLLSTGVSIPTETYDYYPDQSRFHYVQPVNQSLLNVTNTMFFDASNRRVGILTSTPRYNLDISGSLYYSGALYYDEQNEISYSTSQEVLYFSTIGYSSIFVRDSLIIPSNPTNQSQNGLCVTTGGQADAGILIEERYFPYQFKQGVNKFGIFTNAQYSTIDINIALVVYNNTSNVGVGTMSFTDQFILEPEVSPPPIPSSYGLFANGNVNLETLLVSSLNANKTITDVLYTNLLNINFPATGKPNYISVATDEARITVNDAVEFYKSPTSQGYFQIRRPLNENITRKLFCVYNDAYISSVTVPSLYTESILFQSETL